MLLHDRFELHFFLSKLNLFLHDMSFVKIFDLFFPVIILKTCVLFEIHTLLHKSFRVLQLTKLFFNLTAIG